MASKFAWLVGKRGLILAIAAVLSAGLGLWGDGSIGQQAFGFWEGP